MKAAISILIIFGVVFGAYKLWEYWDTMDQVRLESAKAAQKEEVNPTSLAGMPYQFETSLQKAQAEGAKALRNWLEIHRKALKDPRLAWIELDYVLLLSKTDPLEAKKLFAKVKERVPPDSPVSKRVKVLEKTYE